MNRRLILIFGVILFLIIILIVFFTLKTNQTPETAIESPPDIIAPTSYNPLITRPVIKPSPVLNPTFILEPPPTLHKTN